MSGRDPDPADRCSAEDRKWTSRRRPNMTAKIQTFSSHRLAFSYLDRSRGSGCDYSLLFPRLPRTTLAAAWFTSAFRADFTIRGFAISFLSPASIVWSDSILPCFLGISSPWLEGILPSAPSLLGPPSKRRFNRVSALPSREMNTATTSLAFKPTQKPICLY